MASRRDQLNAYTFAKRRMLAAFLQSSPDGSEEGAPRPLRAVLPGVIVGVIVMAVFGAWGMFRPTAPKGWDTPNAKVIVASKSTTRYVVLKTDGQVQLHPVLNMASARLLLEANQGEVVTVAESVLDSGRIPHGVTIGIPYAPDRLPSPSEAASTKRWAVCERPSAGGGSIQKAALVLADRDMKATEGKGQKLAGGQLLYVEARDGNRYVVDANGTAYPIGRNDELLLRAVVGSGRAPQKVSDAWLATLHRGDAIRFPKITGQVNTAAGAPGQLDASTNKVGMVLKATDLNTDQYYVVLPGRVAPVSAFVAQLLLFSEDLAPLGQVGAKEMSPGAIVPGKAFGTEHRWPTGAPEPVNEATGKAGGRSTVCNVLRGVDADSGTTTLYTWAGTDFPVKLPTGSSSAYVTPGSGQLYRQFQGRATKDGPVFLVTDTGLRYVLQSNGDNATDDAVLDTTAEERERLQQEAKQAQTRLGYADVDPTPIPAAWSKFLPTGPRLSTSAARQPQGS
ncbi:MULTISPECIES: type VII secretion protein EccB [unclassified Streptomyces]|uniref:type VII secretion protein EccB n=1 Tax=unclassified Streptomyces TaxID=2593676 RepID=UPI0036EEF052